MSRRQKGGREALVAFLLATSVLVGHEVAWAQGPPSQGGGSQQQGVSQTAPSEWPWKDLVLTGSTLLVAVVSLVLTHWSNRRTLLQKAYEDEVKNIQERLDSFYGPFRQLLGTSERLYTEFRSRQPDPDRFRTLLALLSGRKFTGNDKVLLEQIIEITQKLDDLILAKSALVKEELQATLWEASTHFRLIRLAYKGDLSGEPDRFEGFVYPRALNPAIDSEIGRLRGRLEELRKLGVQ